jgi:outer membrane protein TolC
MNIPTPLKALRNCWLLLLAALLPAGVYAQPVLDAYVAEGLRSNVVLQQRNISLLQAENSLRIARTYFLPSVTLQGDYTSGKGGRSIDIPIGDLLNPVYASLNQLTGSDAFPHVQNVSQNFFPHDFYDAKVRTSLPLINTDLYMNRAIQHDQVALKQFEVDAYKRQLVFDIKRSYYDYLAAIEAVKIYESGLVLVNKNVEINESLTRNGKGLPANLLRSRSEADRLRADLNSANNTAENARRYFNFLLNKSLESIVTVDTTVMRVPLPDSVEHDVAAREELSMLRTARAINQSQIRMSRLNRVPKLSAFLDLGSQATHWEFNNDSRYYLVGVQLSLPLFQGFRNGYTIRQYQHELHKTELELNNTTRQLELATSIAQNDLQTATQNLQAAHQQQRSAQSYFTLIEKGYQQGVNSLIEFLDARNQLTASALQLNLRTFDVLRAVARLERETASYTLTSN